MPLSNLLTGFLLALCKHSEVLQSRVWYGRSRVGITGFTPLLSLFQAKQLRFGETGGS